MVLSPAVDGVFTLQNDRHAQHADGPGRQTHRRPGRRSSPSRLFPGAVTLSSVYTISPNSALLDDDKRAAQQAHAGLRPIAVPPRPRTVTTDRVASRRQPSGRGERRGCTVSARSGRGGTGGDGPHDRRLGPRLRRSPTCPRRTRRAHLARPRRSAHRQRPTTPAGRGRCSPGRGAERPRPRWPPPRRPPTCPPKRRGRRAMVGFSLCWVHGEEGPELSRWRNRPPLTAARTYRHETARLLDQPERRHDVSIRHHCDE